MEGDQVSINNHVLLSPRHIQVGLKQLKIVFFHCIFSTSNGVTNERL